MRDVCHSAIARGDWLSEIVEHSIEPKHGIECDSMSRHVLAESSGGNVSYAQHVIFKDAYVQRPSKHFFIPTWTCLRDFCIVFSNIRQEGFKPLQIDTGPQGEESPTVGRDFAADRPRFERFVYKSHRCGRMRLLFDSKVLGPTINSTFT